MPPIAATREPSSIIDSDRIIIRRLPYMSAMRETIGVATAPVSSVIVTSQVASPSLTPRMPGRLGSNGTTRVVCSATTSPARLSSAVTAVSLCGFR